MSHKQKKRKPCQPRSQSEKRDTDLRKQRDEMLEHFQVYCGVVKNDVHEWLAVSNTFLRKLCQHVQFHPLNFPVPLTDSPNVDARLSTAQHIPPLDENCIRALETGGAVQDDSQPIVHVIACERVYIKTGDSEHQQVFRRYKLSIIDDAGRFVFAKTPTNLYYDVKSQLADGYPIIQLLQYNVVNYKPIETSPEMLVGVFILHYRF
jgi:hypothetical protein